MFFQVKRSNHEEPATNRKCQTPCIAAIIPNSTLFCCVCLFWFRFSSSTFPFSLYYCKNDKFMTQNLLKSKYLSNQIIIIIKAPFFNFGFELFLHSHHLISLYILFSTSRVFFFWKICYGFEVFFGLFSFPGSFYAEMIKVEYNLYKSKGRF